MSLFRWITFLRCFLIVILSPALLDAFISSKPSICSTVTFPLLGNCHHVFVSVSIDFASISKRNAPPHPTAYGYSHVD